MPAAQYPARNRELEGPGGVPTSRTCRVAVAGILLVAVGVARSVRSLVLHAQESRELSHRCTESVRVTESQQHAGMGELTVTLVACRFLMLESTAGRLVCMRSRACHTTSSAHLCLCCFVFSVTPSATSYRTVTPPREVAGRSLFRFLSKYRNSLMFSCHSNLNS